MAGLAAVVVAVFLVRLGSARGRGSLDLLVYFFPTYLAYFGRLAQGEFLRWNPYQLCGLPWLGTLQAGFFYPPHVLYLLLPAHAALFCSTVLHALLAALGMAVLARRLDLHWTAAAAAGLAFVFHGVVIGTLRWPYLFEGTAWIPIGCAAVHRLVEASDRRAVGLLGMVIAMSWLAGSPQSTAFGLYAWGALVLALLAGRRPGLRTAVRTTVAFATAVALGTTAALVALLPSWELTRESVRATGALDVSNMFPFGWPRAWNLWPLVRPGGQAGLTLVGCTLVPFALAARRHRAVVGWCLVVGTLAFLFALGPLVQPTFVLYRMLPVLPWFRVPLRILVLTTLAAALLAAIGLDRLLRRLDLLVVRRRGRAPHWLAPAVGTLLAACTLYGIPRFPPSLPYDRSSEDTYHAREALYEALARAQGSGRVWTAADFTPRVATLFGVRSLNDYEPLWLQRQRAYMSFLFNGRSAQHWGGSLSAWSRDPAGVGKRAGLFNLAAVRWVVAPAVIGRPLVDALVGAGMTESTLAEAGNDVVLENTRAHPRAFVAYRTRERPPSDDWYLFAMANPAFDPLKLTMVDGKAPFSSGPHQPYGHPATIVVDEPEVVEIEATLTEPGLVVLADTFTNAWQATVDGRPAPILRANVLFRGVGVQTAGTHRVRFVYASRAVPLGALASLVGWTVLVGLAVTRRAPAGSAAPGSRGP